MNQREIKFRAWDEFYNKFTYSDDCRFLSYFWGIVEGGRASSRNVPVMQFTGLKDKNGKEIYEGDVVHVIETVRILPSPGEIATREQLDFIGVIEWDSEGADYNIDSKKDDLRGLGVAGQEYEIVGNIYENPELLKP